MLGMFDPLYLMIMAPVFIFSLLAQFMVKRRYQTYSQVELGSGKTGADVARQILRANGVDVEVEETGGWLSDHYSPIEKKLRLSEGVFQGRSLAAAGIAAHEAGHALQHAQGYAIMNLWQTLAKPAAVASNMAFWIIMIGMFMQAMGMVKLGILLFSVLVVFQIITLPVEFNASSRAKNLLYEYNIIRGQEREGVAAVLNAAAMTYVAAAAASVAQLLYFLLRAGLLGGNREE
ncbi:MAG: zinc metallopeptidase [Candidatus Latescibacterota bacterium]